MIEKIKTVYRFRSAAEVVDTLNSLNSNQRPYQYALLDPESNPVLVELRKMNNRIDAITDRLETLERGQKDIRDALGLLCNQARNGASSQNSRGRNADYHI